MAGKRVLLSEGQFNLVATIINKDHTALEGQGWSTILTQPNSTNLNNLIRSQAAGSLNNITLRNFRIQGNSANNLTSATAINLVGAVNARIENIWGLDTTDALITLNTGGPYFLAHIYAKDNAQVDIAGADAIHGTSINGLQMHDVLMIDSPREATIIGSSSNVVITNYRAMAAVGKGLGSALDLGGTVDFQVQLFARGYRHGVWLEAGSARGSIWVDAEGDDSGNGNGVAFAVPDGMDRISITGGRLRLFGAGLAATGAPVSPVTNLTVVGLDLRGNTAVTSGLVASNFDPATCRFIQNPGLNPRGNLASPAWGASPWTFTNDRFVPIDIYITGGTVSGITRSTIAIPTSGWVHLEPNESIVITYSVAGTIYVWGQ